MTLAFRCSRRAAHPGQANIADMRIHVAQRWAAVVCTTCGEGEIVAFVAVLAVDEPAVWDELASIEGAS